MELSERRLVKSSRQVKILKVKNTEFYGHYGISILEHAMRSY